MSATALIYIVITLLLAFLCLFKHPFYGVLLSLLVYFFNPSSHWWGDQLPQLRWSMVTMGLTLLSVGVHRGKLANNFELSNSFKLIIAFLFLSFFVSFNGVAGASGLNRCYALFTYVVLIYLMVKSVGNGKQFIILLFVIVMLGAGLGVEAFTTPRHGARLEGVGPSDANDSNNLALLLASILPLAVPCFLVTKNIFVRLVLIAGAAFICNGIILANSRGAILALGVGCLSLVVCSRSWQVRRRLLLLVTVGVVGFLYLSDDTFFNRFQTVTDTTVDRGTGRLDIWTHGFRMAKDYPFGTGSDGFRRLSPNYLPDSLMSNTGERVPHNTYLLVLIEQGVVGFLVFVMILWSCIGSLTSNIKKFLRDNSSIYFISLGLLGSLFVHLFGSIFGDRLYYEFFFVLIALVIINKNLSAVQTRVLA